MLQRYLPRTEFSSYEDFVENFRIDVPEGFNFAYDVMDELAKERPDSPALVWCDEGGTEATFSYAQLKVRSDKAANFFAAAGIGKGDPVMLILKRRYEFWFSILALHKLGAIAIPATHLLTTKDIVYRNKAADIKMIVTIDDADVMKRVDEAQPQTPSLVAKATLGGPRDGWLQFTPGVERAPESRSRPSGAAATRNGDIMLLYFTSGTTGMPKMVRHDFTYPLGHLVTAKYWQNVKPGGLHFTVSDTGWAKAAWGKIYGQWLSECAVFVYDYDRFVAKELLSVIAKHGVSSFCAPPTIYRFFIKEDLRGYDFSKLEYCTVAGEPLNPEVFNRFKEETGISLKEGYGQTELTVTVATYPWLEPKPGSMGKPSPGYDIDIVDEEGRSCDAGEEGQIVVRTGKRRPVGMFGGYYRDQALTDAMWHDDVYYTGDMAWRDEDGYFWFIGRSDDVIKSSGYRIGPFEVESALLEHPAVLECAITAVPDPDRGQIVKATVVLAKGWVASEGLKLELQEHVKKVTAPYKYPRVIEFVPELPKTISGKIRRVEIRGKEDVS
jgi:acetyl-CoA synthetase